MQILVLNQYFHPDTASTAQLLGELCEDLSREHDVTVVCGRPSYNPTGAKGRPRLVIRDRLGRVRILRTWSTTFPRRNLLGRLTNYATYSLSCLWGAMAAPRPDVILTMTDPPLVAAAAALTGAARRVPFVYVCQDVIPQNALAVGQLRPGPVASVLARLNALLRRRARLVVAIGRDMRERLIELGTPADRIRVIPNWADGSAIRPSSDAAVFRDRRGWADRFVVMHSGNIGRAQDLATLIDAAALLVDDENVRFVLIGDGAMRAELEERTASRGLPNVEFLPYQPREALSASLGAADIHVVGWAPGLAPYALPSKLYGIMAVGRPFIAAIEDGSEPARIIEEVRCGIRISAGDPRRLAATIQEARGLDLEAMGSRGRQAFEGGYDRPLATAAYEAVLREAAGA